MYLKFASDAEALKRSRDEWVAVLGKPKRQEDVTEFLWSVISSKADDVAVVAIDPDTQARLKSEEASALLPAESADVKAVFDSLVKSEK
jgi:hypothetical protein